MKAALEAPSSTMKAKAGFLGKMAVELGLPLLLAYLIMLPRLVEIPAFPLHDVGFNLDILQQLDTCSGPGTYLQRASELQPERFYPVYWLGQHLIWRLGGRSLDLFLPFNVVLLAILLWGAGRIARLLGGKPWLAMLLLLASPGLVENSHTIMKQELPLAVGLILLTLSLAPFFSPRVPGGPGRWGAMFGAVTCLLFTGFLKETALISGLAIFLWLAWARLGPRAWRPRGGRHLIILLVGLFSLGIGVIAFSQRETGPYTQSISLSPLSMAKVAWAYAQAFWPWFLYLPGALLLLAKGGRQLATTGLFVFLLIMICGWSTGYLAWETTQMRYFFPAFSLLAPLTTAIWTHRGRGGITLTSVPALFVYGILISFGIAGWWGINEGRARLTADTAVRETGKWLAQLPPRETVYFLMTEYESTQEFRHRATILKGRSDLTIKAALAGASPTAWAKALQSLAASPPIGKYLLIPFIEKAPTRADRVFPVPDEQFSATLRYATEGIFGSRLKEVQVISHQTGETTVGFRIYRFQAKP